MNSEYSISRKTDGFFKHLLGNYHMTLESGQHTPMSTLYLFSCDRKSIIYPLRDINDKYKC